MLPNRPDPRQAPPGHVAQDRSENTAEPFQPGLDDLGTPLSDVTFVVLDLETTGTSPTSCGITEIGAVKVRGGEVIGEFQTLVNPGEEIPPYITRLTGISNRMVEAAPSISAVLPSLWEFLNGCVLVAHNASFDVSFLRAASRRVDLAWPVPQVVDTLALARRVVTKDEVHNHKLATLAHLFGARITPDHRALSDARATVDVLHALLARLAPWGITHLEDLRTATDPVAPEVRAKRHLADALPTTPGVYMFHAPDGEVLYVGTSVNVRKRVRSYFTAAEKRSKMRLMLKICARVTAISCATVLEANVRELRLISQHEPRFNHRSKHPERMPWLRLTDEHYPRLSVVTEVTAAPNAVHIGPFPSRRSAQSALEALWETTEIRQCTRRLPRTAPDNARDCLLADMGRCAAPCTLGTDPEHLGRRDQYARTVSAVQTAMTTDPGPVVAQLRSRMQDLVAAQEYEEAATNRDRLAAFLQGTYRREKFDSLAGCAELVAAAPTGQGWEIIVIRHGRLAGSAVAPNGSHAPLTVGAVRMTAEHVDPPNRPATAAHPHETLLLLNWLEQPGVRLISVTTPLSSAVRGPGAHNSLLTSLLQARPRRDEHV